MISITGGLGAVNTIGHIESTTAGTGVLRIVDSQALTYTGTGSTVLGTAGATGVTILDVTAPSITMLTGSITAAGADSDALHVTLNGGAGAGGGSITVDGNITTADGSAVVVDSTNAAADQALTVTGNAGTTIAASGGNALDVSVAGSGTTTVTNNSTITSGTAGVNTLQNGILLDSTGTGDLVVNGNGAIGTAGDRAQQAGISASINNAASDGNVTITTGTGGVFSAVTGVSGSTTGTGDVAITTGSGGVTTANGVAISASTTSGTATVVAGPLTTATNDAISVTSTTGNQTITTNGVITSGAAGISAASTGGGTVTANVNANLTAAANGVTLGSSSTKTLNVAGGATIDSTGITDVVFNDGGTGIVNNSGTIGATTTGNAIGTTTSQVTINNGATGTINGVVTLGGQADTFNNSGIWNTAGVSAFGAGTDTLNNNASGTINAAAGASFTGLDTLANAGTINAAAGLILDAGNTAITNTGTINTGGVIDLGAGTDSIVNSAGSTLVIAPGTTYLGLETLTNAGTVTATGGFTLDAGNTAITNTGAFDAGGVIDFGAGTDSFANNVGGTLNVAAGTSMLGLETLTNAGTANVTAGLTFDGGDTAVTNTGTFNAGGAIDFGAGTDSFANNAGGTLAVAAGTSMLGLETLSNAGTVNAGSGLAFDAGNTAITNTGTFNAGGVIDLGAGTDSIANNAGGTLAFAAGSSLLGAETVTNAGTLTANSGLLLDAGNTAITNTGTMNVGGTLDFGAGTDSLANNGAGIVNVNSNTTLAGLETLTNAGRINLNTFTLTGPAIAFNNTGTIDTSGAAGVAGFTTFSNGGTLDLAPGAFTTVAGTFTNTGTILADEGASSITGQTTFANSGTIDLQDGAVGDVFTVNSPIVGSGGSTLAVDFSDATADELIIIGAASGTTAVDANFVGGGLINLDGVQVVDATTATAGAFVLGDVTGSSPLVDVSLLQSGGDFFLISAPNANTFIPLAVNNLVATMWYQSADEVFAETTKPATTVGFSFWGDVYLSRDKYGDNDDTVTVAGTDFDVDNRLKTKRHGIQLGADYGFGAGRVGLTAGYAWAKSDNDNNDLTDIGLKARGWNIGVYGQFGGLTGFHGEALAKYDKYNGEFDDGLFDGVDADFHEFGIDGAVGYRFGMGGVTIDPSIGVSHVVSKADDIDAFGFNYDLGKVTSTRGRAGVRAVFGGGLAPYAAATVYREFNGDGDVDVFDGAETFNLNTDGKATWVRLEGGLSGNDGPGPILALWGDIGDKKGFGIRAGWRLGGAAEVIAPPPPPPPVVAPPPPPPPATQTCPDGSVILATDACPPPPPPPPPPPEPERG